MAGADPVGAEAHPVGERPLREALRGTVATWALLLLLSGLAYLAFGEPVLINFLISVVAVVGLQVFIGNSGVLTLGHVSFMAVGAYCTALLTVPAAIKSTFLELPGWLEGIALPLPAAMAISLAVVALTALLYGIPISRLPSYSAAIASIGVLIVTNVVLLGSADYTNGAQTFYGAPLLTTLPLALGCALAVIATARLFRDSVLGLRLHASREDEVAADALGVDVQRARLVAWVLGGVIVGLAGVLTAHFLGSFSPKQFYFSYTFTLIAMLIVGGSATVSGAVCGAALVTGVIEVVGPLEDGFDLGLFGVSSILGATEIMLALLLLGVMYFRRQGLLGTKEIDELLIRLYRFLRRPPAGAAAPPPASLDGAPAPDAEEKRLPVTGGPG